MARTRKIPNGIHQRKNRWMVDTYYKGLRLRDSFASLDAAIENLNKMKSLVDEGKYLEKKKECKQAVGEFADTYIKWCGDMKQKAWQSKKSHLESIKSFFGKDIRLSRVTRSEVENYKASLMSAQSEKEKQEFKPSTVNRRMATLRHMLSKAVEWNILSDNPCRGVKQSKENNQRVRFLTAEECKALLDACPSSTLKQVVELTLNTGMRKSEALNLKWDHVNLKQGYLEILDQKNGEYSTIPLNRKAQEILRTIPRRLDSEYIFTGTIAGKPFSDFKRQFEKAVNGATLQGVTFHTLRHTAASHMVMNNVPLATVKEILRHKDYSTTLRYSHLSPEHRKEAVETLGEALKVKPKEEAKSA